MFIEHLKAEQPLSGDFTARQPEERCHDVCDTEQPQFHDVVPENILQYTCDGNTLVVNLSEILDYGTYGNPSSIAQLKQNPYNVATEVFDPKVVCYNLQAGYNDVITNTELSTTEQLQSSDDVIEISNYGTYGYSSTDAHLQRAYDVDVSDPSVTCYSARAGYRHVNMTTELSTANCVEDLLKQLLNAKGFDMIPLDVTVPPSADSNVAVESAKPQCKSVVADSADAAINDSDSDYIPPSCGTESEVENSCASGM